MNHHNSNNSRNMTHMSSNVIMNNDLNLNQCLTVSHNNHDNQIQNFPKKKEEINFEKLLIGVLEFKQEAFKSLKVFIS